jgi:hypothetical protein
MDKLIKFLKSFGLNEQEIKKVLQEVPIDNTGFIGTNVTKGIFETGGKKASADFPLITETMISPFKLDKYKGLSREESLKKAEEALVKLGLIEKWNPDTKTGDVLGGYVQEIEGGGFSAGKFIFNKDGSIRFFKEDVEVQFDKNGNIISENTKEAAQKNKTTKINALKDSINNFEKTKNSDEQGKCLAIGIC